MNIVRQRTGTDSAYKQNLYGSGIGIAVLDSGIYPHPDFMNHGSRITAFRDFVNHRQTPYDDNGHGTHIAGIIAGSGYLSEGKYMGMAPRAHLIILKILDSKGNGTAETVCRAIEWTVRICSCGHLPAHPYVIRSGTSMASPVVSGGIALILNKYPDLTNKEVKRCLLKSARPLNYPKSYQGWGFFHIPECLDGRCGSH